MLSIAKVARGRQGYYLATVATGREHDGGLIEADGRWLGTGAEILGLDGTVDARDLDAVLAGRHPATGELISPTHDRVVVAGYDCTFSAPKSVSLLHALGPAAAAHETAQAHHNAVAHTLSFLEDEAGRLRRTGHDRRQSVKADGLTAAGFEHRTSRAPDPHLHTHVIVANCGRDAHGRWSALDGRALFAQCGTASVLYESHLRREVGERLGIRFHAERSAGRGYDIEEFDAALLRAFSRRSAEIEQHLAEHGFSGPRARRIAALATRQPKDLSVPYDELVAGWRERSISLGIPVGHLGRLVEKGRLRLGRAAGGEPARTTQATLDRLTNELLGPEGVTARRASFSRDDLVKAFCRGLPEGASVEMISAHVDRLAGAGAIVPRESVPRWLRGRDGTWFPSGAERERFTTPEIRQCEERIAQLAVAGASAGLAVAGGESVARALDSRPALSAQAQQTVTELVRSGRAIDLLTTTGRPDWGGVVQRYDVVEASRAAWANCGARVVGVAPDRRAAERFEAATAIEFMPASSLQWDAHGLRESLAAEVIVVAGADRIGPRRLTELCQTAQRDGIKVLLVPDMQLERPDSRALRLVAGEGLAIQLDVSPSTRSHPQGPTRDSARADPLWLETANVTVGLAPTAADNREAAIAAYQSRLAAGEKPILVCPDPAVAGLIKSRLGDAGVVAVRDLAEILDPRQRGALLVLGGAISLPAAIRRRTTLDRTHFVIDRSGDCGVDRGVDPAVRRAQALEAGLSPAIVRAVGPPERDAAGRADWRSRATRGDLEPRWIGADRSRAAAPRQARETLSR